MDDYILFPSAIKYDFKNNKVYLIGGSHSHKAQFYDISKSRWFQLKKTNYIHNGKDVAPLIWFHHKYDNLLYVCSFFDGQIMVEKINTDDLKNRWIICDNSQLAQFLDFNVWNMAICS